MRSAAAILTGCLVLLAGCGPRQGTEAPEGPRQVVHADEPIQPIVVMAVSNPARVDLGAKLFFEPRLSKSGFISCNSCHNLGIGGTDGLPSSIGHRWQLGPVNSPTVLNARYNVAQFWDGRAKDLAEQAGGPIANPGEMAFTHDLAVAALRSMPGYVAEFKAVYGTDQITIERVRDAIAAFESTLVTPNSKFDEWLYGDEAALTADELDGYRLFKEKGCATCHNGPAVGGGSFQKFGVVKPFLTDSEELGRFEVTNDPDDRMVFKVSILRNVELTAPYFHDGSRWQLGEAVEVMAGHQFGFQLTPEENAKIVEFLKTLTGEQPKVMHPILPPSTAATPRPERT